MISWGVISLGMMFVRTPPTFYLLRFPLGAAEAGFFPGVVYYLSHWYPEGQRARAIAAFMVAFPVSGVVGDPLSGALLTLNGLFGLVFAALTNPTIWHLGIIFLFAAIGFYGLPRQRFEDQNPRFFAPLRMTIPMNLSPRRFQSRQEIIE